VVGGALVVGAVNGSEPHAAAPSRERATTTVETVRRVTDGTVAMRCVGVDGDCRPGDGGIENAQCRTRGSPSPPDGVRDVPLLPSTPLRLEVLRTCFHARAASSSRQ
jgi:hypothetical protein